MTITVQCNRAERWVRVTRTTATTAALRATVKTPRLARGRYRAVVVLSSSAGRATRDRRFRIR